MTEAHYVYCAECDEQHFIPGTEPEFCQCERPHHANGLCGRRVEPGTEFCLGCIRLLAHVDLAAMRRARKARR